MTVVEHVGSCHCGAVKWRVMAPSDLTVIDCTCSICTMKQNHHFIVPESNFQLLSGETNLTTYRFNTRQARHTFCSTCGVQSFYRPRSNPDGMGVAPHCITSKTVTSITTVKFDGQNWEQSFEKDLQIKK